ncbi:hypothetical protein EAF04_008438 [Stromatinia cepivora]|nr:hypothetical protein EAF04_008438 [Stromatinia cepivora]
MDLKLAAKFPPPTIIRDLVPKSVRALNPVGAEVIAPVTVSLVVVGFVVIPSVPELLVEVFFDLISELLVPDLLIVVILEVVFELIVSVLVVIDREIVEILEVPVPVKVDLLEDEFIPLGSVMVLGFDDDAELKLVVFLETEIIVELELDFDDVLVDKTIDQKDLDFDKAVKVLLAEFVQNPDVLLVMDVSEQALRNMD